MHSTNYNEDDAVLAVLDHKWSTSSVSVLNAAIPVTVVLEPQNHYSEQSR